MTQNQAGITALITAYARAYHATHDSPKIFDDFLADQMYTPQEHIQFDQNLAGMVGLIDPELAATQPDQATALASVMQRHHCPVTLSRSRYTEDHLAAAIQQGLEQYIILGAGLDTFAFRRPDCVDQVQVYELDHPVTQAMKRERIGIAGWQIPPNLHLVPIDFTHQNLRDVLLQSGYQPEKKCVISWLGVTYYLPREAIETTLNTLQSITAPGSTLIFDYMDADAFQPEKAGKRVQLMQRIVQQTGEPMKTGFDPLTLPVELARLGYHSQENLSPAEIETRYFQGRTDLLHAFEHIHFIKAVTG